MKKLLKWFKSLVNKDFPKVDKVEKDGPIKECFNCTHISKSRKGFRCGQNPNMPKNVSITDTCEHWKA